MYKYIVIAITVVVLLVVETAIYFFLRKLTKDASQGFKDKIDDFFIRGIGIIVGVAGLLWFFID